MAPVGVLNEARFYEPPDTVEIATASGIEYTVVEVGQTGKIAEHPSSL
ncbi:MAG: hypothetical protein ABSF63_12130 [Candidatus Bathyarchaeia archaeon]